MATFPNIPDLPTPITPDGSPPSELPVEPDEGAGALITGNPVAGSNAIRIRTNGSGKTATELHFMANRQFMFAAAFRWPRASASLRTS